MEFYDDLMAVITEAEQAWESTLTASEKALFNNVLQLVKQLDVKGGDIVVSVANLRTLNKIKKGLGEALLTDKYLKNISEFVSFYTVTDKVQNKYFSTLEKDFTPPNITNQIRQQAIDETIESLAGSGVKFEVLQPVRELITTNVTTGGNWADMVKSLDNIITSKLPDEGRLRKYTSQIVTDAINQYSRNYSQTITEDLGLVWYQYVGGKVQATRPLCNALVNQRYVHQSELPKIVKGVVKGRQTALGKNGLPLGQIPGTNATNFQTYCGGWRCSHHLIPVSEISVPKYLVEQFKENKNETETVEFEPPKTVAEAKQRILKRGVKIADIDNWSLGHATQMVRAVETVPKAALPTIIADKAGLERLSNIKIKRKIDEWQGVNINAELYNKETKSFTWEKMVGINTKGFKTPSLMSEKKIKYNDFYSNVKNGDKWYFNTFDGSSHFHELGHIYDTNISTTQEWIELSNKWHKESRADMIKVSQGGDFRGKNGSEAFAEAFASYYGNNKKGLPNYIVEYFDKNIK